MRRIAVRSIVLVTLLLLGFALGAITAIRSRWASSTVIVDVKNESVRRLDTVTVTYTTCGQTRALAFKAQDQSPPLLDFKEARLEFVLCGEGSHITEVRFTDGHVVKSAGSYIQGGYTIIEKASDSGISSESSFTLL